MKDPQDMTQEEFETAITKFAGDYFELKLPDHQMEYLVLMHFFKNLLLLAPRGHGKTTLTMLYIAFRVCYDPRIRVLIASHKEDQANITARNIQRTFEREAIVRDFGLIQGKPWKNGIMFFKDARHPAVYSVAMGAGMTGWRGDIVLYDDPLTVKNSNSEKKRDIILEWMGGEVYPALDRTPKRKTIIVGTRKHLEDMYSVYMQKPSYEVRIDQLYTMDGDKKTYLWPEVWNEEEELEARTEMGPAKFAREMMNDPFAQEGLRFKRSWLKFFMDSDLVPLKRHLDYYMGIDPSAGSKKVRSTYAAISVIAFDKRPEMQNIYVVDMVRTKVSLSEQLDVIKSIYEKWNYPPCIIEAGPANIFFADWVFEELPGIHRHRPNKALTGTSVVAKIGRIENIVGHLFKTGRIYLKDEKISPMTTTFIEAEFVQFPEGDMDLLDSLNMACSQVRIGPFSNRMPVAFFR